MSIVVIDASIAIKWVVEEDGSAQALALRGHRKVIAPDLLVSECANVLWKKVVRRELEPDEARIAAKLLARAEIELFGTRALFEPAIDLALQLEHPAYDCVYFALAIEQRCRFITADEGFVRKIQSKCAAEMHEYIQLLNKTQLAAPKTGFRGKKGRTHEEEA
ncbi:MAG: PIN domain nuclease [Methylocystaceae bacterium]|nr:MAG: PIN domain nuclease [Methylocystaceae bacterium]